jgi:hypothetical protein
MIVALYNLESPKIHNSAMMQVSQYHKQQGDEVEIYNPILKEKYDRIYAFSLFDFTDKGYVTSDMIVGGTGFDIKKRLPLEIEICDLDYSIDPNCDYSMIWFSRGCIRHCSFCIVRDKEGLICSVQPKNLNPQGKYIMVMDNNFFANSKWREAIAQLKEWKQPVNFLGVDIRLLNKEMCEALNSLKLKNQIHIAWDNAKEDMLPKLKEIIQWIKPYKLMCFVLIGFDSTKEEDLYRVKSLMQLKIDPFAMPYNKKDRYQKDFARWCNRPQIRKTCEFKDYKKELKADNER